MYPSLREFNDGFVDRFFICSPKPKLLLEEEVENWCVKLEAERLQSLSKVYKLIGHWHSTVQRTYTFSTQAKEQYRLFANEITRAMNSQFDGDEGSTEANCSKDKRTVIRSVSPGSLKAIKSFFCIFLITDLVEFFMYFLKP